MKVSEIRKLSDEQITKKISEEKIELFELRLKQSTGSLEKPSKIKELRKNIAKYKTILKERSLVGGGLNGK